MTQPASQLILMAWFSPAFPVGGFAFSHGLEWAYEAGIVTKRDDVQCWIEDLLQSGSGQNDAILLAASYHAMLALIKKPNSPELEDIIELSVALQPTSERCLEAHVQGTAFYKAILASWPHDAFSAISPAMAKQLTYPVATGLAAAVYKLELRSTLNAYLQAFAANLISASVRLGIIGQTDGQRIMAAMIPAISEVAERTLPSTLADLGNSALRADMMSFHHETQYSRLFRS